MKIEIGKKYATRDGQTFVAEAMTGCRGTYAVVGSDQEGRPTWRSVKGRFTDRPHGLDIVREA